jgi:hypothetical protein
MPNITPIQPPATEGGGTTDHNALSNLQGGASSQYYHVNLSQSQKVAALGTISSSNMTISTNDPSGAANDGDLWIKVV